MLISLKVILLGTGDAVGTPNVGCDCPQCLCAAKAGKERLRTSLLIEHEGRHILIDTSPDLRRQLLLQNSPHIDAVIWTHGHYDHFMGFGEFYRVQRIPPVYAAPEVLSYCSGVFGFLVREKHEIPVYTPFSLFGLEFTLVEVKHPNVYTTGVVFTDGKTRIVYTSDTNEHFPDETKKLFMNPDFLFIDGLFPNSLKKVDKHLNYEESIEWAGKFKAKDFRVVHMSHHLPFSLPHAGYDGETFEF